MKLRRAAIWIAANVLLWIAVTVAFGYWIDHEVRQEYRLGYRASTDGDSLAVPIAGFALVLGAVLLGANLLLLLVRFFRRRHNRLVT